MDSAVLDVGGCADFFIVQRDGQWHCISRGRKAACAAGLFLFFVVMRIFLNYRYSCFILLCVCDYLSPCNYSGGYLQFIFAT